MSYPTYDWKRFWVPRDGSYSLFDGGYLTDPDSEAGKIFSTRVVPFSKISHHGCLVLLGEPGMGKTTAMESEQEAINKHIANDGEVSLWQNLNVFASDVALQRKVFDCERFTSWAMGTHTLHLFLDSLDECRLQIGTIVPLLLDELRDKDISRLRLRIACRTAEWPVALENGLRRLYKDDLHIFELAPLRRKDIAETARCSGFDPEAFLAEVDQHDAVPFAIKPVTLKMLLKMFELKKFPSNLADLYRKGCEGLCEESNETRIGAHRSGKLTPQQCVLVAKRIAAMMAFCQRTAILVGPAAVDAEPTDLTLKEIVGGGEPEVTQDGRVEVTKETVTEVLDTGLFSSRGQNRVGWAHYTYVEFLASEYVLAHQLTPEQTSSLIMHPLDPTRVVPQLHGTAGWIAGADEVMFERICASDPQVSLRSDTGTMDSARKSRLLDAYLGQLEEKADTLDWGLFQYWGRLRHPGLALQLEPYVKGKERNIQARLAAIDIAQACDVAELQEILAAVALDATETLGIRESAAAAVARVGDRSTKARLRPLAEGDPADKNNSIKAQALRALWPGDLTTKELFKLLTPSVNPHYPGTFRTFLHEIVRDLRLEDLPDALDWVAQHPSQYHSNGFWMACKAILTRAWEHLENASVLVAFAKVARARMSLHEPINDWDLPSGNSARRRMVVQAIVELERSREAVIAEAGSNRENEWWNQFVGPTALLLIDDLAWAIDKFRSAGTGLTQKSWTHVLKSLVDVHLEKDSIDPLIEAAEYTPALRDLFANILLPMDLQSERVRNLRDQTAVWNQRTAIPPREGPPLAERMAVLIARCENGEIGAFPELLYHMAFGDKATDDVDRWAKGVEHFPGWRAADGHTRGHFVDLGKRYLTNRKCKPAAWTGENVIHWPEKAACHTLRLLEHLEPTWLEHAPTDVWQRWGATILGEADFENRPNKLLEIAFRQAPDEILARLEALIDQEDRAQQHTYTTSRLLPFWNRRLEEALLAKVRDPKLAPSTIGDLLQPLLAKDSQGGLEHALFLLHEALPEKGLTRDLAAAAALELLLHAPELAWPRQWPWIVAHPELGCEILTRLAKVQHGQWTLGDQLREDHVAELFLWLSRKFPRSDDPANIKTGPGGDPEQVADFRDALLDRLSARATPDAVSALTKIGGELDLPVLPYHLLRARKGMLEKNWLAVSPENLLGLAKDRRNRLVSSGGELKSIILESLGRYQQDLHGENPARKFLWDEQRPRGTWWPKDENTVSDHIAQYLDRDLTQRGVVVNLEVVIRRKDGDARGQRTDIHVDAVSQRSSGGEHERLRVIIEVKGCWNSEVDTAMRDQLRDRYLKENECRDGIYLVAWFNCSSWDPADGRLKAATALCPTIEETRKRLDAQATDLSVEGCSFAAFVLDAALR